MSEPMQEALPGTDVPASRPRRGRPRGAKTRKLSPLFSDGAGDYRLYVVEEGGSLTPVADSTGYFDCREAIAWLRANGARQDLQGRTVMVLRGLHLVRLAMQAALQFKPRTKVAEKGARRPVPQEQEPATAST